MDMFEALGRSRTEFEKRLPLISADHWRRPTPCTEWDIRALVNHVIGGCRRYTMLLHGASADETEALKQLDHIGGDHCGSYAAAANEMMAAFAEPGALDRTVHHPAGDRPGAVLAGMRVVDFSVHAWDLARSIEADETMDVELVQWMLPLLSAMGPSLSSGGYFRDPGGDAPASASLQEQLLHLTGRTP